MRASLLNPLQPLLILIFLAGTLACEKRQGDGEVAEKKEQSNQDDKGAEAAPEAPFEICSSLAAFLKDNQHQSASPTCCWEGQTVGEKGCLGVPSSCPEPLLVYPPEQRCDPCAGAQSCEQALATCSSGEDGGQPCLVAGSNYARNSQGLRDDLLRSTSLFLAACEAGSLMACNNAAIHYERAIGVSQDLGRAVALFERACPRKEENAPGCKNLARVYQLQGKSQEARTLLLERCEKFSAPADCSALLNIEYGDTVGAALRNEESEPDFDSLIALGRKACDIKAYPKGCTQLATLLIASTRAASDNPKAQTLPKEALSLLEEACEAKEPTACFELARLFHAGDGGIEQDEKRAFALYDTACQGQVIASCGQAAMFYMRLAVEPPTTMDRQARIQRALQLGALACSQAEISGCQALAMLEHNGERAASEQLAAVRASSKTACSASPPNILQCALLGELQVRGLGGELALKEGRSNLENACSKGVVGACQRLSMFKK